MEAVKDKEQLVCDVDTRGMGNTNAMPMAHALILLRVQS